MIPKEIETLQSIYRLLDSLKYECEAREYKIDSEEMSNIFAARDLAWLQIEKWKKENG